MGWFNKKSESLPAEELIDKLESAKNAKERKAIMEAAKKGKFNLSAEDLKKARKFDQRVFEGERGIAAMKAALKDSTTAAARQRYAKHYEAEMRKGVPHSRERLKAVDPKAYQKLLDQEARRQGLI